MGTVADVAAKMRQLFSAGFRRGCLLTAVRKGLVRAGIVVLSLVVVLTLVELGLRVAGFVYQRRHWSTIIADHAASRSLATVLVLGEFATTGLWVPSAGSYPKQLESRLREHFGTSRISVVVPPHQGQNTSHMVHRLPQYLRAFRRQLVIVMAGVNNAWSLTESNLPRFLPASSWSARVLRWRNWLDEVKVVRFVRLFAAASGQAVSGRVLSDAPRFSEWPPRSSLLGSLDPDSQPFLDLWPHDVGAMITWRRDRGPR